ncbi:AIR synthase-related protein [Aminirod propionatiphilus]
MMSKFSRSVLDRAVYSPLARQKKDPSVLLGSRFGEDIALVDAGGTLVASHVDPIVGAAEGIGRLAVHVACNDLAASAVRPRWLQILVLLPDEKDAERLRSIMDEAVQAAGEAGAVIIGGHSGYTSALNRPLVAVTALGCAEGEIVSTGGARIGDSICLTRGAGLEGTAILATDYEKEALRRGLEATDIAEGRRLADRLSLVPEALALAAAGATAMHDPTRGGVIEALLEMAEASDKGFAVDGDRLPLPPVVRRFAKAFDFDPLRMLSSGALVLTLPEEKLLRARRASEELGVPLTVIGTVERGSGLRLGGARGEAFFSRSEPERDELARLEALLGPPGQTR